MVQICNNAYISPKLLESSVIPKAYVNSTFPLGKNITFPTLSTLR